MASRAYFRCRACGEPVMAGAYRCPVCGIDFPSGTPGAPNVTEPFDSTARYAAPPREDIVDAEFEPDEDFVDDTLHFAPGAERAFETWDVPPSDASSRAADLNVRPREDQARAGGGGSPTLSVRPARESSVAVTVSDVEYESEPPLPRRSWARGLVGTLICAVLLLAIVAGGAWWFNARGGLSSSGGSAASAITVDVTDGWVDLPTGEHPLVVEADGPFRLRVAGKVYSLRGDRPIQVPAEVDAAVRIVRGPTSATVRQR